MMQIMGDNMEQKLTELLQTKVVEFSFKKNNGEIRFVFGTANPECIPEEARVKERPIEESIGKTFQTIRFYDLEKKGWRSCRKDSIEDIHGYMSASLWFSKQGILE